MSTHDLQYTPLDVIKNIHARVHRTFKAGVTLPLAYRRRQLLQMARMMQENATKFEDAVLEDLGKQRQETTATETIPVLEDALLAAETLEEWAKPEKPQVEAWRSSWDTTIYRVPKGVSLIIAPWNYPVILSLRPVVGAIAAGCPAVVKPSESAPATAALIADLLPKYLDTEAYAVVNGEVDQAQTLLDLQWSHIFYTGSTKIGRVVAAAAGKFTTPVTLGLGGKSPVIVSPDTDLELAAKRILFGKVQNVGQLCVSPDYLLVPRSVAQPLYAALKKAYDSFFPVDPLDPESKWGKLVNEAHFKRVKRLLDSTKGEVILGGKSDSSSLRIALTIVADVKLDDSLMEEEIFGPVFPIVEVEDVDEAIQIVSDRPHPLVVYCFANSDEVKEKVLTRTNSGTLAMNDTFMQLSVHEMPFGGHGESGYGGYFGKATYDLFSHRRSYINVPSEMEPFFAYRYLPYSEEGYKVMTSALRAKIPEA